VLNDVKSMRVEERQSLLHVGFKVYAMMLLIKLLDYSSDLLLSLMPC
jgi:hypothetical protein